MKRAETVQHFIERAIGNTDKIRIEADDIRAIVGNKNEVLNNKRIENLYFAGFGFDGNTIVIDARYNELDARESIENAYNR